VSTPRARTTPDFAEASPKHQNSINNREEVFREWQYNVADHLKGKSIDEIKSILIETSFPFAVCFEHWTYDFNISTGVRNANAFNAREVFYIGDKKWDKRGAQGVYNYMNMYWLSTIEELMRLKDRYIFVGVDNVPGSIPINSHKWQKNTLMIFGEESTGLTPAMQDLCSVIVNIPMYGSVRSINCGTASGIAMNDFVTRYKS